jgi:hypothetical protein
MYNSTQMAPEVTQLRMTRLQQALADTDWQELATDEFPMNEETN